MDFQNQNTEGKKFVCPSDRHLALRAKLKAGWSSSKCSEPLRPEEQAAIISVIRRNEELEQLERQRVGRLVERVQKIKQSALERGPNCCRLCGDTFGLWRPARIVCQDCRRAVCARCSVDISVRYHTLERSKEYWLCRICSETREMWKKSGAWFFKGLPTYEMPTSGGGGGGGSTPAIAHCGDGVVSELMAQRPTALSCHSTPTRKVRKLTIRVKDSSSSDDDEDDEDEEEQADVNAHDVADVTDAGEAMKLSHMSLSGGRAANEQRRSAGATAVAGGGGSGGAVTASSTEENGFRSRTFGSLRSFIDGSGGGSGGGGGERKLSNAFYFARSPGSQQPDYDTISTASTVATTISSLARRESNSNSNSNSNYQLRRGSVSSSWSISDSSSANSATVSAVGAVSTTGTTCTMGPNAILNPHCRDTLLGWLEVVIKYRESYHTLDCTMVRARDLPPMDAASLTDAYCALNIITAEARPKYTRWQRTKTVHKTRNPEFNETLSFVGVEPDELGNLLLYVAIFDDDKYGHDLLGGAKVCLSTVYSTSQYRVSVPLGGEDQYSAEAERSLEWSHGKMLISLSYNTKRRALAVRVKQCVNLIPMDNNGSSDPFVKLQLKPDPHRNKKFKTSIKWRTLNPIYNEEFFFEASPHDLNKQSLIVTVWDKDLGKSNDFLGSLIIGYNSKGERLQQWLDCIRLPDAFHEKWHCLAADNPTH